MTNKINKIIDTLKRGIPVFYTQTENFNRDEGRKHINTWADYVRLNLEHGPLDMKGIMEYMSELKKCGPTKDKFIYPSIICELPFRISSKEIVDSNAWMINQLLALGVHGFLLCHAESAAGVFRVAQYMTYSFNKIKYKSKSYDGLRGHGGQKSGSLYWGLTELDYMYQASLWPIFPNGKLLLGVKIENKISYKNHKEVLSVPGVSFAEWGPGDTGMSLGYPQKHNPPYPIEMIKFQNNVRNFCQKKKIHFLNAAYNKKEIDENIKNKVMYMRIEESDTKGLLANYCRKKFK